MIETAQCTMHCAVWSRIFFMRFLVRCLTSSEETLYDRNGAVHDALRRSVSHFFHAISCALFDQFRETPDDRNGAVHDALRRLVSHFFHSISCALFDQFRVNRV